MANKTTLKKAANKQDAGQSSAEAIERGIQLVERGDRQAAFDLFQQTVELDPNAAEAWVWLGGTSSSIDAAELAFERAYSLDPDNEEASLGLRWARLQRMVPLTGAVPEAPAVTEQLADSAPVAAFAPAPARQTVLCPNCGTENGQNEKFCVRCGQNLVFAVSHRAAQEETAAVVAEDRPAAVATMALAPAKRGFDRRVIIGVLVALIVVLTAIIVWYLVWGSQ